MSEKLHTQEPWEVSKYIDRFWSNVDIKSNKECWEWKKGTTADGYGVFHYGNSSIRAHRFSYQLHNRKLEAQECVCHSCDNPKCVNPNHLWTGTRAENNADMEAKGRAVHVVQKSGENNSNAELTVSEVIAIRVMSRKGMPQARIANYIGISPATVCMIVGGERRASETEKRVSACVNACRDMDMTVLEMPDYSVKVELDTLDAQIAGRLKAESQRDELLAALKDIRDMSLNPAHTMTYSGLEGTVDGCHKTALMYLEKYHA